MAEHKNLYLDLYSSGVPDNHELMYHRLTDREAFDGWHCILYGKEIALSRELLSSADLKFAQIPRKERNVLLFLILKAFPHIKNITEVGSSLLEIIDGLELINKYFITAGFKGLDSEVSKYHFRGIERSAFLRQLAMRLHQGYDFTLVDDCAAATDVGGVLFDRTNSSYAFNTSRSLADFLKKFDIALLNLYVSKSETFSVPGPAGAFTYFSLKELVSFLDQPLFHLFGYKSPAADKSMGRDVIEGFFLYGTQQKAERFIKESQHYPEVKGYFSDKEIYLKDVCTLF